MCDGRSSHLSGFCPSETHHHLSLISNNISVLLSQFGWSAPVSRPPAGRFCPAKRAGISGNSRFVGWFWGLARRGGFRRDILSRSFSSELGRPLTASIFIVPCLDQRDGSLQNQVWWVSLVPTALSLKAGSVSSKTDVWFLEYSRRIVAKDYGWKL